MTSHWLAEQVGAIHGGDAVQEFVGQSGRPTDYGLGPWYNFFMEEIAISKFKATCLAVLKKVRRTRKPILVTRFGEPVAEVVPSSTVKQRKHWIGALRDTGHIRGDIISPAGDEKDWELLRP